MRRSSSHRDRPRPHRYRTRRRRLRGLCDQPLASSRYRDRHAVSGAKSDPGDAKVLGDIVRTDRHNHRSIAGDSSRRGVKILARAHQSAIWARQRQLNALRSSLREYYPAALAAFGPTCRPTMQWPCCPLHRRPSSRQLSRSKIAAALRRGGRSRNIDHRPRRSKRHSVASTSSTTDHREPMGQRPTRRSASSHRYDRDRCARRGARGAF